MPLDGENTMAVDTNTLTSRAMLVSLSVRKLGISRKEKNVAEEVAQRHGNAVDMCRVTKSLLSKDAIERIKAVESEARTYHYEQTLPWLDSGARILPSVSFFEYSRKMTELHRQFDEQVSEFIMAYPGYVSQARRELGDLFNVDDYPDEMKIKRAFDFDVAFNKVPEGKDFRVSIGDEAVQAIAEQIEQRNTIAVTEAMREVWERVHESVSHMVEKLKAYKPADKSAGEKAEGIFRDSLVDNVRGLVDLLPRLNLTGSAELAGMADRLRAELCAEDAEILRKNDTVRSDVAARAEAILAEVSNFLA